MWRDPVCSSQGLRRTVEERVPEVERTDFYVERGVEPLISWEKEAVPKGGLDGVPEILSSEPCDLHFCRTVVRAIRRDANESHVVWMGSALKTHWCGLVTDGREFVLRISKSDKLRSGHFIHCGRNRRAGEWDFHVSVGNCERLNKMSCAHASRFLFRTPNGQ